MSPVERVLLQRAASQGRWESEGARRRTGSGGGSFEQFEAVEDLLVIIRRERSHTERHGPNEPGSWRYLTCQRERSGGARGQTHQYASLRFLRRGSL